jgi:hypothetical protein
MEPVSLWKISNSLVTAPEYFNLLFMDEHCIKICLNLSSEFGSAKEIEAIHDFSDTLEEVIEKQAVGEFDGDEFGGGTCTLYMYGPDADRLFEAVSDPLQKFSLARNGHVIKRYGPPADGIKEVRIDL